jgi:hypothetical protein
MGKGSGSGFAGPGAELLDELFDGGALGGANVVAAVGDADEEGEVIVEVEEFTEAEAGVEMVASAGGDLGFGRVEAFDGGDGALGDGESVLGGVNDEGMDRELLGDLTGELAEGIGVAAGVARPRTLPISLASFSLRPRMTSKCFWKRTMRSRAWRMSSSVAFFGIGEIEEHFATGPGELGAEFFEDGFPDLAHVGEHGPVDEADEAGGGRVFVRSDRGRTVAGSLGQVTSFREACLPIMTLPSSNSRASVWPGSAMLWTSARWANSEKTG